MPDRYGEDIPEDPPDHICNDGWVGDPNAEHPKPCTACKPHLDPEARRRKVWGFDTGGAA